MSSDLRGTRSNRVKRRCKDGLQEINNKHQFIKDMVLREVTALSDCEEPNPRTVPIDDLKKLQESFLREFTMG